MQLAEGEYCDFARSGEDEAILAVQNGEGFLIDRTAGPQQGRVDILVWWTSGNHQGFLWAHEFVYADYFLSGLQNVGPDLDADLFWKLAKP